MEVILETNVMANTVKVFMVEKNGSQSTFYYTKGKEILDVTVSNYEIPAKPIPPLFELPINMMHKVVAAFAEAGDQLRIPKPKEDFLLGKLQSKEQHLEDFRKIAFKLLKIEN